MVGASDHTRKETEQMTHLNLARREFLQALAASSAAGCLALSARGGEPPTEGGLKEPVFRVAKAKNEVGKGEAAAGEHPLDPALKMAREALKLTQETIDDYTCTIVKRERIKGVLGDHEYMQAKVRNRKLDEAGKIKVPLSVYLKFVKPKNIEGREVVWVEGQNNNKLKAHEGGLLGRTLPSVWLDPDGALAMRGQLHPIYDIGIENLVAKLIERGEKERKFGECEVKFVPGGKINGRGCTVLVVEHPVQRPHFEFHKAEIFIDDEFKIPLRYAAYFWPAAAGGQLPVIEEYTYLNVKLNVGLKNEDFDPNNPNYSF
jgi:uncharacterized protein DUF1571